MNLTATGAMLRALTIVSVDEGTNTVVIGFARAEEAEKALYHDQIGAGPRRVIRHFMGVSPTEKQELAAMGVAGLQIKT